MSGAEPTKQPERLTVGDLYDVLEDFDDGDPVKVRFEGSPPMPVEGIDVMAGPKPGDPDELILVMPAQPTDDAAVDSDFGRICEKVMRGESTILQVRFGMDLFRQANANTPALRLFALSKYFEEAKRRVDEMAKSCFDAGEEFAGEGP